MSTTKPVNTAKRRFVDGGLIVTSCVVAVRISSLSSAIAFSCRAIPEFAGPEYSAVPRPESSGVTTGEPWSRQRWWRSGHESLTAPKPVEIPTVEGQNLMRDGFRNGGFGPNTPGWGLVPDELLGQLPKTVRKRQIRRSIRVAVPS